MSTDAGTLQAILQAIQQQAAANQQQFSRLASAVEGLTGTVQGLQQCLEHHGLLQTAGGPAAPPPPGGRTAAAAAAPAGLPAAPAAAGLPDAVEAPDADEAMLDAGAEEPAAAAGGEAPSAEAVATSTGEMQRSTGDGQPALPAASQAAAEAGEDAAEADAAAGMPRRRRLAPERLAAMPPPPEAAEAEEAEEAEAADPFPASWRSLPESVLGAHESFTVAALPAHSGPGGCCWVLAGGGCCWVLGAGWAKYMGRPTGRLDQSAVMQDSAPPSPPCNQC